MPSMFGPSASMVDIWSAILDEATSLTGIQRHGLQIVFTTKIGSFICHQGAEKAVTQLKGNHSNNQKLLLIQGPFLNMYILVAEPRRFNSLYPSIVHGDAANASMKVSDYRSHPLVNWPPPWSYVCIHTQLPWIVSFPCL